MQNLAHSASFESLDKDAPSKAETKHLVALKSRDLVGKVALVGFDALPEALGEIKVGNLTATIEQKPGGQSRRAVDILVAFLRDGEKPMEQVIQLAPLAITRNNVADAERIDEVK
jgi:inositol transport system substrate-binding protein